MEDGLPTTTALTDTEQYQVASINHMLPGKNS